jgi:hypothetical protein
VREKAEGNPLFVEEIAASLLERGMVVRRNGEILWSGGATIEFPDTIQDIIRARIDRLEEPVKRTVQAAAVIGREFGLGLLARVSDSAAQVQSNLDVLTNTELIHETRFYPELEYIFKHAVTQDVAYQSLLTQRRKELHAAIATALEEFYADRLADQAPILAYHYLRSDQQDKAVKYALLAGDRASSLYANAEAASYYEQALNMARNLPPTVQNRGSEIDAALKLAAVGMTRQQIEGNCRNVERARALAEELQDDGRQAQALYWLGRLQYLLGNSAAALEYAGQSLAIADRLGNESIAALPVNLIARAYYWFDLTKACQMIERSVEQMARLGNKAEEASALSFAALLFASTGVFDRALQYADRSIALAVEIKNPIAHATAYFYRGVVREQRGELACAIDEFECATRLAEPAGDLLRVYIAKFWEARAYVGTGDASRGRIIVEEGFALATRIGTDFVLSHGKVSLAQCLLELGELDEACRLCRETISLTKGDQFHAALAHRTLAQTLNRLSPSDAAAALGEIEEAIRIQQEIGARPELARSYLTYARLLKGWGESERAEVHLTHAVDLFREMGMAWDLKHAEEVMRQS